MLPRMDPSSPPVKRTLHLLKTPDILCANDRRVAGINEMVTDGSAVIRAESSQSGSGRVGVRGLPGPQLRGTGGTLIVFSIEPRDRSHPPSFDGSPRCGANNPLQEEEERCETKQQDQDQPDAEQPDWDIASTVDGEHCQKNDQRDAATLDQFVSRVLFKDAPKEQPIKEKNQHSSPDSTELASTRGDHHVKNPNVSQPGLTGVDDGAGIFRHSGLLVANPSVANPVSYHLGNPRNLQESGQLEQDMRPAQKLNSLPKK